MSVRECVCGCDCACDGVSPVEHELILACVTVPGNPQNVNVTAINSTTIHVEWKPPGATEQNGVIRGYHVHVHELREEVCILVLTLFLYF